MIWRRGRDIVFIIIKFYSATVWQIWLLISSPGYAETLNGKKKKSFLDSIYVASEESAQSLLFNDFSIP